jgi:hypothetical protein
MTSYINQTLAREHITGLIAEAEQSRLRRDLRRARWDARRPDDTGTPPEPGRARARLRWAHLFGLVAAR